MKALRCFMATVLVTLACLLPGAAFAASEGVLKQVEEGRPLAVIENGVLISIGKDSFLRYDAVAGVASLRYAGGLSLEFDGLANPTKGLMAPVPSLIWVRDDRGEAKAGNCGAAAAALVGAIQVVQMACAGGGGSACDQAVATMQTLYSDYLMCLTQMQ